MKFRHLIALFALAGVLLPAAAQPTDCRVLFTPGEAGARSYRIPAIVTAADGTIVAVADRRWDSSGDLPGRIDIVARRSTDNGRTWGPVITVVEHRDGCGYGDAALVVDRRSGDILCICASGPGFFQSASDNRLDINVIRSKDNGLTWSEPTVITDMIYGRGCSNPVSCGFAGAFAASGRAEQTADGRLLFVVAVRKSADSRRLSNFVCSSSDGGYTWELLPEEVCTEGDESKIVELADGSLLMSIRNPRRGCRKYAVRPAGGEWREPALWEEMAEPACDGDLLRYRRGRRECLIHSIPLDPKARRNVSLMVSSDNGVTWSLLETVWSCGSAYSALAALPGGEVGLLSEVEMEKGCYYDICFTRHRIPRKYLKRTPQAPARH